MQGDGAIESTMVGRSFHQPRIDSWNRASHREPLYFNIPELASDADDYLEGNGGDDLMYGGLGQDDMIGRQLLHDRGRTTGRLGRHLRRRWV